MNLITINLTAADAVSIASLINATTGHNLATDQLEQVRIYVTGNTITAIGTNRYLMAGYETNAVSVSCTCAECAAGEPMPEFNFGLSANAAKFITANVKRGNKWNTPDNVELIANLETRELSVRHGAAVIGDLWPAGNYPAVLQVYDNWEPATDLAPVTLSTKILTQLTKFVSDFGKVDQWLLELGTAPNAYGRPGPVRATFGKFLVIAQPMNIKK